MEKQEFKLSRKQVVLITFVYILGVVGLGALRRYETFSDELAFYVSLLSLTAFYLQIGLEH